MGNSYLCVVYEGRIRPQWALTSFRFLSLLDVFDTSSLPIGQPLICACTMKSRVS